MLLHPILQVDQKDPLLQDGHPVGHVHPAQEIAGKRLLHPLHQDGHHGEQYHPRHRLLQPHQDACLGSIKSLTCCHLSNSLRDLPPRLVNFLDKIYFEDHFKNLLFLTLNLT